MKDTLKKSARQRAIESGAFSYTTGKACKHGHYSPRYTSTSNCTKCHQLLREDKEHQRYMRLYMREYETTEKRLKWRKEYRERMKEKNSDYTDKGK